ncbi:hypothetical protein OUZ56_016063 [Daphnia magna]|uniref:Uncharacterized protein n=1 Tax=Daphnia magna TaxID=35525 RepID=A0ABR0APJ5_9CRUS|nr:hypothetical protein OUZ56_016063 [Daphnia magna]
MEEILCVTVSESSVLDIYRKDYNYSLQQNANFNVYSSFPGTVDGFLLQENFLFHAFTRVIYKEAMELECNGLDSKMSTTFALADCYRETSKPKLSKYMLDKHAVFELQDVYGCAQNLWGT